MGRKGKNLSIKVCVLRQVIIRINNMIIERATGIREGTARRVSDRSRMAGIISTTTSLHQPSLGKEEVAFVTCFTLMYGQANGAQQKKLTE